MGAPMSYALSFQDRCNSATATANRQPNYQDLLVDTMLFTSVLAFNPDTMGKCEEILTIPKGKRLRKAWHRRRECERRFAPREPLRKAPGRSRTLLDRFSRLSVKMVPSCPDQDENASAILLLGLCSGIVFAHAQFQAMKRLQATSG